MEAAGETFTSAEEAAANLFNRYKKEYYCLEGAKEEDYANGTCSDASYLSSTSCNAAEKHLPLIVMEKTGQTEERSMTFTVLEQMFGTDVDAIKHHFQTI